MNKNLKAIATVLRAALRSEGLTETEAYITSENMMNGFRVITAYFG